MIWGVLLAVLTGAAAAAAAEPPQPRYWLPQSAYLPRAPNWSYAGYREGDTPLPFAAAKHDARRDFGAVGDGQADDTAALQAAVAAANKEPGVLLLPAGTYRLRAPLEVTASGVVIRGEGEAKTRIVIDRSLADIAPNTWSRDGAGRVRTQWAAVGGFVQFRGAPEWAGRGDTRLASVAGPVAPGDTRVPVDGSSGLEAGQWVRLYATLAKQERQVSARVVRVEDGSIELDRQVPFGIAAGWRGSVHRYAPALQDCGVEMLSIEFESEPYGAHGSDRGYNAIFVASAANAWVQQVTVMNADNALLLHRVDRATVLDVTIDSAATRWAPADAVWRREGHHALRLDSCTNVLVSRFLVGTRYWHDLALAGGSLLNAFTGGQGLDLNLHHEGAPLANLFSDLSLGRGNRPWGSPGGGPAGPRATFWNLRVAAPDALPPEKVAAPASGCGVLETGVNLFGGDLDKVPAASWEECLAACRATPGCGAATLVEASWGGCYLKRPSGWQRRALPAARSQVLCSSPEPAQHRRLAAIDSARPLPLPPCTFGANLNFFGSWAGTQCPGWVVTPLNASLPDDLQSQQWFERGNAPPVSAGMSRPGPAAAREACQTFMGDPKDPLECWELLYDHCIPGYTNRNSIPKDIRSNERKVLQSLFDMTSGNGDFGKPPARPAAGYSRVCVARPELAGTGNCKHVRADDYRIHVFGFSTVPGRPRCDHAGKKVSFVKAHIDGRHRVGPFGRVGH